MAGYPTLEIQNLSDFSGRPVPGYPDPYSLTALAQATLLFRLATALTDWPTDADQIQLATYAILQMADAFVLAQPFQAAVAAPFQSETIGGYSYSKALRLMQAGQPTGVFWFDLAVQRLGTSQDIARVITGSLQLFEQELRTEITWAGVRRILGPSDINPIDTPFSISQQIPFNPNKG